MRPRSPLANNPMLAALALLLATAAGCRNEMYDQPKFEPLEASNYFADGASARRPVPGTVARLDPKAEPRDQLYRTGRLDDQSFTDELPFPLTRAVLDRGLKRYNIYCIPCHGLLGDGRGMIVERGFSPPPSLIEGEVVQKQLGHYYDVITNGHGAMYSYAARIPPRDRWCIAAYLRALQLGQRAKLDQLPAEDRQKLRELDRAEAEAKAEARTQSQSETPSEPAEGRESHR